MKKLFIYILTLIPLVTISQEKYFLLPEIQDNYLFKLENKDFAKLSKTDFPIGNLYEFFDTNRLISINRDSTQILFTTIIQDSLTIDFTENLPTKFKIRTLKVVENYLLVGGDWNSDNAFYVFDTKDKKWHTITVPEEIFFLGKAMDDFLLIEDKIIAVDNIVMPKYLIEYNISDLPDLKQGKIFMLEPNGTYENIKRAVANENYIVLLSGTVGGYHRATADHISVLNTDSFENSFSISSNRMRPWTYLTWTDIEIVNKRVYVACKERGLGSFRIYPSYFNKRFKLREIYEGKQRRNIGKWRIRFRLFSPRNITDLIKFDETRLIIIYKDKSGDYHFRTR